MRHYDLKGTPLGVARTYFWRDVPEVTRTMAEKYHSCELLEMYLNTRIIRTDVRIGCEIPDAELRRILEMDQLTPVLIFKRVSYSDADKTILHTEFIARSE